MDALDAGGGIFALLWMDDRCRQVENGLYYRRGGGRVFSGGKESSPKIASAADR